MSQSFLVTYARQSMPPEFRAENFALGENRLTWTSLFFSNFPSGEIYLVGGTLRDVLLGRVPSDIDLVIRNIDPDELENWLNNHGAAEFVGKRFGTFKFAPHGTADKEPIDIALPRTEVESQDHASSRRSMQITTDYRLPIKEDLARRDFTINAMAYELRHKRLIDPHMGLNDLHSGIIRAVLNPEKRFFEDASRMIRGLRFASQLKFGIEENTWRAIQNNTELLNKTSLTENGMHIFSVARESIGKEFLKGFIEHPIHTLDLWQQSGVLKLFMPKVNNLVNILEQDGESTFEKTKKVLHLMHKPELLLANGVSHPSPTVMTAALLSLVEDDTANHAHKICKSLYFHQFPKRHRAYVNCENVLWLLSHATMLEETDPASLRPVEFEKIFLNARGHELLLLIHATYIAKGKHSVARERVHIARRIQKRMENFILKRGDNGILEKLVSGHDISQMGVQSGPVYRELIDEIRDAQLTEKIKTPFEAKRMLQELVSRI